MEIVIVLMLNSGIVSNRVKRAYEMQTQYPAVHVWWICLLNHQDTYILMIWYSVHWNIEIPHQRRRGGRAWERVGTADPTHVRCAEPCAFVLFVCICLNYYFCIQLNPPFKGDYGKFNTFGNIYLIMSVINIYAHNSTAIIITLHKICYVLKRKYMNEYFVNM